ncbi:metallophosphoesterase family protein [Rubinisphaera margarita]|uniref:metallophosphoesterase family protein n=1 Tax=Rubinisphaera margarita TaxID=2909586 RepID=UPI001EE963B4|nr:metallophosphoesterase [Rubinisphaera margarita]MCG6155598.1 metallophosphoesterase [Rubinisphaera margarita]
MPVHLPGCNRRQFLVTVGAGLAARSSIFAAEPAGETEDDLVYLLNDTHIGEKHPPNSPVPSHLRQIVTELVNRERKPASVIINGDLALYDGQPGDYAHLGRLLNPLYEAGVSTHLTLGNHDNREVFYEVLKNERPDDPPVAAKHLAVVETRFANFFLLDSLKETMVTQGLIDVEQRDWLKKELDARPDKPAIIVAHHNPRLGGDPLHFPGGLIDSPELWDLLVSRTQVKAYVHGHIHDRSIAEERGIHIINTPATSYVADPTKSTTGWTTARLSATGVQLTTHTTDAQHAWNGEVQELTWRTR